MRSQASDRTLASSPFMNRTRSRFPRGPWYWAIFMRPSGGYLFLYPGSMSKMFLFAIGRDLHFACSAHVAENRNRRLHSRFSAQTLQRSRGAPIDIGDKFRELRDEIALVVDR